MSGSPAGYPPEHWTSSSGVRCHPGSGGRRPSGFRRAYACWLDAPSAKEGIVNPAFQVRAWILGVALLRITSIPAQGSDYGVNDSVPGMILPPISELNFIPFSDNLPDFPDGGIHRTDTHFSIPYAMKVTSSW